jgi:predicted permease
MALPVWLDNRAAEFRFALRMLRKTPGVTAVAVLSLALGIGANTAVFSLVDAMLLKRLPVKAPEELYQVASGQPARPSTSWNYVDYRAMREHSRSFNGIAAYSWASHPFGMQLAGAGSTAEIAYTSLVSGNYFEVFGVGAAIGRLLTPEVEAGSGGSPYAVLSYDYWRRRFGGGAGVVGRALRLNGYPFTIIGVSQRGFRGADVAGSPDLFIPITMLSETQGVPYTIWNTRNYWWLAITGRIKPGVDLKQAEAEMTAIGKAVAEEDRRVQQVGSMSRARQAILLPAGGGYSYIRSQLERPLLIVTVVVGVVLLIACANLASVMLARGAARQREIAVRLALGAGRSRLAGQLFAESVLIALAGGALGLAFAYFGVQVLLGLMPKTSWMQVSITVSPDVRLLGFTFGVTLLTAVLFGIVPALRSTRPDLVPALKEDAAGATGAPRITLRKALVVVQVALSLLLLVGAGLFVRSLGNLREIDLGFRPERTIIVTIDPTGNGYQGQRLRDFYERLRAGALRLPGVQSASLARIAPLSGARWNNGISVEGYQPATAAGKRAAESVDMNAVSPRYFETVGIPLLLGRDFREEDNPPYSVDPPAGLREWLREPVLPGRRVAIVNESFAKRFLAGRSPLGAHLCLDDDYDAARAYEIVGVAKDAHYFGLREAPEPMIYLPVWRAVARQQALCLRTTREAPGVIDGIRRVTASIDPAIPVLASRTIEQQIDQDILEGRVIAKLASFFGLLAVMLAGIGLYGVISYSVARRTREIGIRMALGAQRGAVLWLVLRDAALLVGAGAVIGIPAALAAARLVKTLLFGVGAEDPATIVAGALVLGAAAALACFIPARRATRVAPNTALHYE